MNARHSLWVSPPAEPLRERTQKVLRDAIISQHLKPGERLIERDLCERTGVSRSSIREALRYLESEGLVERHDAKGMFVSQLTKEKADEIYEVRAALEAEAAKFFAIRATDEDLKQLEAAYKCVELASLSDPEAYANEIDRFFEVLFTGARNATAHALMNSLHARINFLRHTTTRSSPKARLQGSNAQMKLIVEALKKRDPEAAAQACRGYIARSAEFAAMHFAKT